MMWRYFWHRRLSKNNSLQSRFFAQYLNVASSLIGHIATSSFQFSLQAEEQFQLSSRRRSSQQQHMQIIEKMKTAIVALLLTLFTAANAFTNSPIGKAMPRLGVTTETQPHITADVVAAPQKHPRDKESVVLNNMLRSYANWNDIWDGDYGYGGYGMMPYGRGRGYGGYGRYGGYGGGYGGYG